MFEGGEVQAPYQEGERIGAWEQRDRGTAESSEPSGLQLHHYPQ